MTAAPVRAALAVLALCATPALTETLVLEERAVIAPADASREDFIGTFFTKHQDTLFVSSHFDDLACPADVHCNSGSAYLFRRNQGGPNAWGQVVKLIPSDPKRGAYFGYPIVTDGTTAVVGAYADDSTHDGAGAAYVFERNLGGPDRWSERVKLVPPDATAYSFGTALALQGDTVVVTTPADAYPCPEDPQFCVAGSAYVFERDRGGPNAWGLLKKIVPPEGMRQQLFGHSAALQGDTLIVAAPTARWPPTATISTGVLYVFARNQGGPDNWGFVTRLVPSLPPDSSSGLPGWYNTLAFVGNTVAVGAHVDSRACDYPVSFCGAVHIFSRSPQGIWSEAKVLLPPEPKDDGRFGLSVALFREDLLLVGENGPPERVYAFARDRGGHNAWGLVGTLVPSDVLPGQDIGFSGSVAADTDGLAAVGAVYADRACPTDPSCDSGAIYLYDLAPLVGGCVETAMALCLSGKRFRVEAWWRTPQGETGLGQASPLTSDTGYFWFFNSANVEVIVKVLNACAAPVDRYWVFAAGLTNVEVELQVTDTMTGAVKTYMNPLGQAFRPIQDTGAFATCP